MSTEQRENAVNAYINALNNDDLDAICALYADDAVVEDPVGTPPHKGQDAIRAFYSKSTGIGIKAELTGAIRCPGNDAAAFPFKVTSPMGVIEIIDVFEFDAAGKVVSMKAYWSMPQR